MGYKIKIVYGKYLGEFEAIVYKKRQIWNKVFWLQQNIFRGDDRKIQAFVISFQSLHDSSVIDSLEILNEVKLDISLT
jgi:hypothetical protein